MRVDKIVQYHAIQRPQALALIQDDQRLSFADVEAHSLKIANGLRDLGLSKGDRLVIVGENSIDQVLLILAAARIGAVSVTLNYRLAAGEMRFIIGDASTALLAVLDPQFVDTLDGVVEQLLASGARQFPVLAIADTLPHQWLGWRQWWPAQAANKIEPVTSVEDAFLQLYTSGTTGLPKGAVISHRNIVDLGMSGLIAAENRPAIGDTELIMAPLFHIGAIAPLLYSLMIGVTVIVHRSFNPMTVVDTIERFQLKSLFMVPAMIQSILAVVPDVENRDFGSLKRINYGASPIGEDLLKHALQVFGCDFQQSYGMTETAGAVCQLTVADHKKALAGEKHLLKSCGRPNAASQLCIVDPDGLELADDEMGELLVKSTTNMLGYWNQPEKTAEALRDGWLHTGDVAYRDPQGYYYLVDRRKDMVVSGGENIYPNEIERILLQHETIDDVAIIGVPDQKYGEALLACCVMRSQCELDAALLIAFCREHLAGYKIPRQYKVLDELPRNLSGKVLKKDLRKPYWEKAERQIG